MNGDSSKSCFNVGSDPRDYSSWGRGASYYCVPSLVVLVEKYKAMVENRKYICGPRDYLSLDPGLSLFRLLASSSEQRFMFLDIVFNAKAFWASQYKKDKELLEKIQQEHHKDDQGSGASLLCGERLRELGLFSLGKRRLRGDLINAYKYLKGRCQQDGPRLFSVVPSHRTRNNGHKLKHRKFHLNMKNFFTLTVAEPREVTESCSLETFKNHLDAFLCNLLR
ncbi:hypothetical protein BTVI_111459 [Pitangus sulphuratus]|nr:hypothetical protein BTVI_111459 [Pitangus sulphuratus]